MKLLFGEQLFVISMIILTFVIIYSSKTKGRENFFLLGICFLIPSILFIISAFFIYLPNYRLVPPLIPYINMILGVSLGCGLGYSIKYFIEYFKRKNKNS